MANAFGLASMYDPSIATDQAALDRQAELAKLLRAQSMAPLQSNAQIGGMGYRVSPLEGIAKIMQGMLASKTEGEGDKARQGLATKQAAAMAQMLRGVMGDDAPATSSGAPTAAPSCCTRRAA